MNKPLVSIISPCYNGESYVGRFLDSVLCQTYLNIEFIFVNDGSSDRTEEIVLSYRDKFTERGIDFKYIYKENGGPASAINAGLKIFCGEYLTWPDSDDVMNANCIERKVEFLERHREYGMAFCCVDVVTEDDGKIVSRMSYTPRSDSDFFYDLLDEKIYVAPPLAWMVRATAFLNANPERHIYDGNKMGQNWQMLLPCARYGGGVY